MRLDYLIRKCSIMAKRLQPIIVIVGATATGKSKLAVEMASEFCGEIISTDSMQVRGCVHGCVILWQMVKCGPAGMRACSLGLIGLGIRLGLVFGIGLVLGLEMVLGLAHFTFCHTCSPQNTASPQARILPITSYCWHWLYVCKYEYNFSRQ